MQTFRPIVVFNGKGKYFQEMNLEQALAFSEKYKDRMIIFETKSNHQLTLAELKSM